MTETYTPPAVWTWTPGHGGQFASINRPVSGPTHEAELPVGQHPFQLYSLASPNGQKVGIMFEELLEAGVSDAEYDAWLVVIGEGQQFSSGFVALNPNSKIPALLDRSGPEPLRVFESGAILLHLAEKFGRFLPTAPRARAECFSWLMWQMGSAPFIGGGFGHFYAYAPEKWQYPIDRYAMETKRLCHVADTHLAKHRYFAGDDYSIADMAAWGWLGGLWLGNLYSDSATFLGMDEYEHLGRWALEVGARPGVRRGRLVNRSEVMPERHAASDFAALDPELLAPPQPRR